MSENLTGVMDGIPQELSTGGLTLEDRGYKQQTFCGASIRSFNIKAGFGDESSTLSVELIEDEYNQADSTEQGKGADAYHNGKHDKFVPPFIGSPVFFTFGKDYATVAEAYRGVYEHTYGGAYNPDGSIASFGAGVTLQGIESLGPDQTISDIDRSSLGPNQYYDADKNMIMEVVQDEHIGREHLTFGGILQSFVEQSTTGGNKTYSVKVTDPREILNSVQLILNNYTGGINQTDNIFNLYGFLEHNPTSTTVEFLGGEETQDVLTRHVDPDNGTVSYSGTDTYTSVQYSGFPITGTGFSRRSDRGIPYYRVVNSVNALLGNTEDLPQEYKNMSFGDKINFRGLKYIVDLSGLPAMPDFYSLNYDSMTLLDLCLEICEVTNTDLYVTLLPIINEPACNTAFNHNLTLPLDDQDDLIVGMIRCEAIDRKEQPSLGAVQDYINDLLLDNIYVKNSDTGYELANITTDKFVVGAQETNMHFFSDHDDRDHQQIRAQNKGKGNLPVDGKQWLLKTATEQQIIPYYGTIGKNCVSLPRGWGSYQQILLDSSALDAAGVGNYYVATEMELRCALAGYEDWCEFLLRYNETYLAPVPTENIEGAGLKADRNELNLDESFKIKEDEEYAVVAPRSVFPHYGNRELDEIEIATGRGGRDGEFLQPVGQNPAKAKDKTHKQCNPPMGWPLYWRRATNIGIGKASEILFKNAFSTPLRPSIEKLVEDFISGELSDSMWVARLKDTWSKIKNGMKSVDAKDWFIEAMDKLKVIVEEVDAGIREAVLIQEFETSKIKEIIALSMLIKQGEKNARKVHAFLQEIAEECLGKKYLVKIPNKVNVKWGTKIAENANCSLKEAPYGLRPQPKPSGNTDIPYKHSPDFISRYSQVAEKPHYAKEDLVKLFLSENLAGNDIKDFMGELSANYNPFGDEYEFNYYPESEGGFFSEDIYKEILDIDSAKKAKNNMGGGNGFAGLKNSLVPMDIAKFMTQNHRIAPYVRFDNSHELYFGAVNKNDFSQEFVDNNVAVPDVVEALENLESSSTDPITFRKYRPEIKKSMAFVKCQVDTELYYLPEIVDDIEIPVYDSLRQIPIFSQPKESLDDENEDTEVAHDFVGVHFIPTSKNPCLISTDMVGTSTTIDTTTTTQTGFNSPVTTRSRTVEYSDDSVLEFKTRNYSNLQNVDQTVIDTTTKNRNLDHVYALITLPTRVEPTADSRYRDGVNQQSGSSPFHKHLLAMDVVKNFIMFEDCGQSIPYATGPIVLDKNNPNANNTEKAFFTHHVEKPMLAKALRLSAIPSVAMPNLVCLPLLSTERCYGPWNSQWIDTRNQDEQIKGEPVESRFIELGGAVDFIKEENIAPWNYSGYKGMNEAGKLQAQFSNNLLLSSERGSFSYADAPKNVYLAEELRERGPLVTNINVSIGTRGIVTNVSLDLYTVSFGKLHKYRQQKLEQASRERLKLRDEKNLRIRKNVAKDQKNEDYQAIITKMGNELKSLKSATTRQISNVENNVSSPDLVSHVSTYITEGYDLSQEVQDTIDVVRRVALTVMQPGNVVSKSMSLISDFKLASKAYSEAAGGSIGKLFAPFSQEPQYPIMTDSPDPNMEAKQKLYPEITIENTAEDDLTKYED